LRRACAVRLHRKGYDLRHIREVMGLSALSATKHLVEGDLDAVATSQQHRVRRRRPNTQTVITLKAMHVTIRQTGNSQGVVIPKPVLAQLGFDGTAQMTVEGDAMVLRGPALSPARRLG
jgi:hypothetical protein